HSITCPCLVTPLLRPLLYFLLSPRPPRPTLFPYTTLFRSAWAPERNNFRAAIEAMDQRNAIGRAFNGMTVLVGYEIPLRRIGAGDRKSTRLNSSHVSISYAVFCLKKKKKIQH